MGKVYGHVPYVGMITIFINDYPQAKTALIMILGLAALLSKEETS
jgi:signal peptidase